MGGTGGGRPELEATDIAGALAFVPPGLGRELLEFVWWPDGALRRARALDDALKDIQLAEFSRLEAAMYSALAMVACGPSGEARKRAHAAYAKAHENRWPSWIKRTCPIELAEGYELIRFTALEELAKPRACIDCEGKGMIVKRELVTLCARCKGDGRIPYGPSWRATRLKMKEPSFKKTWERPYIWLFDLMRDALTTAEGELLSGIK